MIMGHSDRTYEIPEALKDDAKVAIRLDSEQGYYSYNWFYNNPNAVEPTPPIPGYSGYPTFTITSVEEDRIRFARHLQPASRPDFYRPDGRWNVRT